MRYQLFCDGGARGNPGLGAGGAILFLENKVIDSKGVFCGKVTNNQAEYYGLLLGLSLALENEVSELEIFLDSKLLVGQVSQNWKTKNESLKLLCSRVMVAKLKFKYISFTHISRDKNQLADKIVNQVLDEN